MSSRNGHSKWFGMAFFGGLSRFVWITESRAAGVGLLPAVQMAASVGSGRSATHLGTTGSGRLLPNDRGTSPTFVVAQPDRVCPSNPIYEKGSGACPLGLNFCCSAVSTYFKKRISAGWFPFTAPTGRVSGRSEPAVLPPEAGPTPGVPIAPAPWGGLVESKHHVGAGHRPACSMPRQV
jgi:hypothetical protein